MPERKHNYCCSLACRGVGEGNEWGFSCTYVRAMGTQKVQRRPQLVSAARSLSLVLRRLLPPLAYLTVTDVITVKLIS